jgi:hypothetical protein
MGRFFRSAPTKRQRASLRINLECEKVITKSGDSDIETSFKALLENRWAECKRSEPRKVCSG